MKEIKAYIKPHTLSVLALELHKIEGLTGMSVTEVKGFGRGKAKSDAHRLVEDIVDYVPHIKLEIVCTAELLEQVLNTISDIAHTGRHGDGKIYIMDVQDAIRIRTGERGIAAV